MALLPTLLLLCLSTFTLGDGGVSGGGQSGYGAPSGGYGAPTGNSGYDSQVGYDYDQQGYETQASVGGDDLGKQLKDLVPLFIAVFAAIILAQLLAPLLLQLLGLLVAILPMALGIKAPLINLILNTFDLNLCRPATATRPLEIFPPAGRSMGRGFSNKDLQEAVSVFGLDISEDKISIVADLVEKGIESFTSTYTE